MKKYYLAGILLVLIIAGTKLILPVDALSSFEDHLHRSDEQDTDTDVPISSATQKARATVDEFLQRFLHPHTGDENFSVKMMLQYQTETEHVWLTEMTYEDGVFVGHIADEPSRVTHVRKGEIVQVHKDDIVDWMWRTNGELHGGFTLPEPS